MLIQELREHQITIVPIPGASAISTLLSVAGVTTDQYIFGGFFPRKQAQATTLLNTLKSTKMPILFFESPNRIVATITWLESQNIVNQCIIGKELTKTYETIITGSITAALQQLGEIPIKGEFSFIITFKQQETDINKDFLKTCLDQGLTKKQITALTTQLNYPKNKVYDVLLELDSSSNTV